MLKWGLLRTVTALDCTLGWIFNSVILHGLKSFRDIFMPAAYCETCMKSWYAHWRCFLFVFLPHTHTQQFFCFESQNHHWFITRASKQSRAQAYRTCSHSKCCVWLELQFACVWAGWHMTALSCHLAEGRKHVTGFSSHTYMCRPRAEAAPSAVSASLALYLLWKSMHMFCKAPLAPDISAKKPEGENYWKVERLGKAQMDASAERLTETSVPAASSLPLISSPLGMSALCCFGSRSLCSASLLILFYSSVFSECYWHNQFSLITKHLRPGTLQRKVV